MLMLGLRLRLDQSCISKFFTFAVGWVGVGVGGVEKWRLRLTSAKVEVEVEAELGKGSSKLEYQKICGSKYLK